MVRVPYTDPFPAPRIIPASATTPSRAIAALADFLSPSPLSAPTSSSATPLSPLPPPSPWHAPFARDARKTLLLTGAGISVASGLADYRGAKGTYTLNKTYRPIYYTEFRDSHEARKRYWARSFLGWTNLDRARPNGAHEACGELGRMGVVGHVITQNVDSFHPTAHPALATTELHGYLRSLVCLTCHSEYPRPAFQSQLAALNPTWAAFLAQVLAAGALATENPAERRAKGLTANPDGDVDVPGAPYTTFRYPACPVCQRNAAAQVVTDADGAWHPQSTAGVLKPAVVMFGENVPPPTKLAAERAVDAAARLLVVGSSLATYSAWRLVKRAKEAGLPVAVLNIGGVRGEDSFFGALDDACAGRGGVRLSHSAEVVLPAVVRLLKERERERITTPAS